MGRMTITIDDKLLSEVKDLLGARSKTQAIVMALQDVIRRRQLQEALSHRGAIDLELDQDELVNLREGV